MLTLDQLEQIQLNTTYVTLVGIDEEMYLVTDVIAAPDLPASQRWIQLDRTSPYSVAENYVPVEKVAGILRPCS